MPVVKGITFAISGKPTGKRKLFGKKQVRLVPLTGLEHAPDA